MNQQVMELLAGGIKETLYMTLVSTLIAYVIGMATILGYFAMAGFVGGGGLGAIAINYGYYRYQTDIMLVTVAFLVLIVQLFQEVGIWIVNRIDKRSA